MAMNSKDFSAIILAAGKGTRMKSPLPKVLHPVAGVPMIKRVIDAVKDAGAKEIRAVVGFQKDLVRSMLEPYSVNCYAQLHQNGTADAVRAAQPENMQGTVLILNGDHPLLEASDLKGILMEFHDLRADIAVVTAEMKNPGSLGRIVRGQGHLKAIVEASDASSDTLKIREVNSGIYCVKAEVLAKFLPMISNANAKGEYYLTDIISLGLENGAKVVAIKTKPKVAFGVNTQLELAKATGLLFKRKRNELMENGVLFIDPNSTYVESDVKIGESTVVYPGTYIGGRTSIGRACLIGPQCFISHSHLGDGVQLKSGTYIDNSVVNSRATLGPYAHLRPDTEIGPEAHVGNFVEMKKTKFGARAKAGHLTYLGDAEIGEDTNIGCGTITCNYAVDRKKYRTRIGKGVFVGSDTQFVAPVTIGDGAVIGSGSTITKDVPAHALGVARAKQFIKENYTAEKSPKNSTGEEVEVAAKITGSKEE